MTAKTLFSKVYHSVRRWQAHRTAIRHLESLDDRQLRDVGLERRQITDAVSGAHAVHRQSRAGWVEALRHEWRIYHLTAVVHPLLPFDSPRVRERW